MASSAGLITSQAWISGFTDAASFSLLISPAVKRTGSIGNVDVLPFIFTFFNCLMWVADSIPDLHQSMPVLIINAVGSFLEFIWILLFLYCSAGPKRIVAIVSLLATMVVSAVVFTLVFTKVKQNKWPPTFLGYLAAGSGVAMYLLPVWSTAKMVRLNDGGDLNMLMVLSSLANGGLWCAFAKVGRRRINWFIMIPNITALVCATGQCIAWLYLYLFLHKPPGLPVVAENQGGAVGRHRVDPGSRAGPGEPPIPSSSAVVTNLEMVARSGSLTKQSSRSPSSRSGTRSKPGSGALSVSDASGSRSPVR